MLPCDGCHSNSMAFIIEQRLGSRMVRVYPDYTVCNRIFIGSLRVLIRFSDADFRAPARSKSHSLTRAGHGFQIRPFPPREFLVAARQARQREIEISALRR